MSVRESVGVAVPQPAQRSWFATFVGCVGNALEWYDFGIYGYFAVVISKLFFPTGGAASLLLTFATFGVGFLMRPLGAVLFGWLGDRRGRRAALAVTVVGMGVVTPLMGLLPTYAVAGVLAPALLVTLRLLQGLFVGGEWAGSASYIVESAPAARRGFAGSWQEFTVVIATLLGASVGAVVNGTMTPDQVASWGWRIPFFIGIVVAVPGIYLRLTARETPKFQELQEKNEVARSPLAETFAKNWRPMLQAGGFTVCQTACFWVFLTYMSTYLSAELTFSPTFGLLAVVATVALLAVLTPPMGALSDRVGRKPLFLISFALFAIASYPLFLLLKSGNEPVVIVVVLAFAAILSLISGPAPAALVELFPTRVRYSALSISYQVCIAIFGGFASFIATLLITLTGNLAAPAFFVIGTAIISFLATLTFRETANTPLA